MEYILDFEKPVNALENQLKELKNTINKPGIDVSKEIQQLEAKVDQLIEEIYLNLSPWERVQLARHPNRPQTSDYINGLIDNFHEIHGDRKFSDDRAIISGFGYLGDQKVAIIGIEKGKKTADKIIRNFGMANPDGYRKALRVMKLAAQYSIPIITFVDTPGAYPGIGAEQRGQAQAIADNLEEMFGIDVPMISLIIGEGGSGGALGLAITDKVFMLEHAVYSVISPESCASILWSDPKMAERAANSLQLTAKKSLEMGIIDGIIREPLGGCHRHLEEMIKTLRNTLDHEIKQLKVFSTDSLKENRWKKFRSMGNQFLK